MRDEWAFGLILVAAAATPACSNETNQNIAVSMGGFAGPMLDYDLALDAAMWDDSSESTIPRPLGALLDSWASVIDPACVPNVAFVDADQDRVPASYSATFACTNQTSAGGRVTNVTGSVTITDGDDHSSTSGYAIAFDNFVVSVSIPGNARSRTLNGTISMVAATGAFRTTRNLTVAFDQSNNPNERITGTNVMSEAADYAPDAGQADPFAGGVVNLSGQSTLSRSFLGTEQSRTVTRSTRPPLHWSGSCRAATPTAPGFDSGTLTYVDNEGGSVQVTFNGCSNQNVTNNTL
jgi:hypothetical protein